MIKQNIEQLNSDLHIPCRTARAFRSKKEKRNYWLILAGLLFLGLMFSLGLLLYNNPVPVGSPSFIPVVKRRLYALLAMTIPALAQSLSTVAFSVHNKQQDNNPIPSGF